MPSSEKQQDFGAHISPIFEIRHVGTLIKQQAIPILWSIVEVD